MENEINKNDYVACLVISREMQLIYTKINNKKNHFTFCSFAYISQYLKYIIPILTSSKFMKLNQFIGSFFFCF